MLKQTLRQRSTLREFETWKRTYNRREILDCGHSRGNYPVVVKDKKRYCCEACSQAQSQLDHLSHIARLPR